MKLLTGILSVVFLVSLGEAYKVSDGGIVNIQEGDEIFLRCSIQQSSSQDKMAALNWDKKQDDSTLITTNGFLSNTSPFYDRGFRVDSPEERTEGGLKVRQMDLKKSDAKPEDSGTYACFLQVSAGAPVAKVVYDLNVIQQVEMLEMRSFPEADQLPPWDKLRTKDHQFSDMVKGYLKCQYKGGYPMPVMKVTAGERLLTDRLQKTEEMMWNGTDSGFKTPYAHGSVESRQVQFLAADDEAKLKCEALVDNQVSKSVESIMSVMHGGHFNEAQCGIEQMASMNDMNAVISCELTAKPTPTIFWRLGDGTEIKPGQQEGHYIADTETEGSRTVAKLTIDKVGDGDFQDYELVLRNAETGKETVRKISLKADSRRQINASNQLVSGAVVSFVSLLTAMIMLH